MKYDPNDPAPRQTIPAQDRSYTGWIIGVLAVAAVLGMAMWGMSGTNSTTANNPGINSSPGTTTGSTSTPAPAPPAPVQTPATPAR